MTTLVNVNPQVLIDWFDDFDGPNAWGCFSNFHVGATVVLPEGSVPWPGGYPTGEHAFQVQKARTADAALGIAGAGTPGEAKARGRRTPLRADWEDIKDEVMWQVLLAKFAPGRAEHDVLLASGEALLVEGTWWNDRVWGVDLNDPARPGENRLGRMLMRLRGELGGIW